MPVVHRNYAFLCLLPFMLCLIDVTLNLLFVHSIWVCNLLADLYNFIKLLEIVELS